MFHVEHAQGTEKQCSMSNAPKTKSRLGRGLSSLISVSELPIEIDLPPDAPTPFAQVLARPAAEPVASVASIEIPTDSILPNPHQPRKQFDEAGILSLAASLKSTGVVRPIIVRPSPESGAGQF